MRGYAQHVRLNKMTTGSGERPSHSPSILPAKISQRRPPGGPASVSLRSRWLPPRVRAPPMPHLSRRQKQQQLLPPPPPPPPRRRSSTRLRFPHNPIFYSLPRSLARFLWLFRSKLSSWLVPAGGRRRCRRGCTQAGGGRAPLAAGRWLVIAIPLAMRRFSVTAMHALSLRDSR